jgi:DNA/RNA endonuclease YhcR with UshA esterase domain
MKLNHIIIILALAGISILYFLTTISQPAMMPLSEIPNHEGKLVSITGIVNRYYLTSVGGQIIEVHNQNLTENNASVTIFSQETTPIEYGDYIKATGKIQKYQGAWEVVVENAQDVVVLQHWRNITVPLWQLANAATKFTGLNIVVDGTIDSVGKDDVVLKDQEGKHHLIVQLPSSFTISLNKGDYVSVCGVFTCDEKNMQYLVKATNISTAQTSFSG